MLDVNVASPVTVAGAFSAASADWLRPLPALLLLLLAADVAFAALHVANGCGAIRWSRLFRLGSDRSYAEIYQYLKLFWAAAYAVGLALATRPRSLYVACALLFAYLLADDAFMIHERLGGVLAATLALPAAMGLRAQDFGELLTTVGAAAVLLGVLAVSYVRAPQAQRSFAAGVLGWIGALAAFGVGIDLAHVALGHPDEGASGGVWWELVEDGGEMVAASGLLVHLFAHGAGLAFPWTPLHRRRTAGAA